MFDLLLVIFCLAVLLNIFDILFGNKQGISPTIALGMGIINGYSDIRNNQSSSK